MMHIKVSEEGLESFISDNLDIIEPNLKLIRRQYMTRYGKIDILCLDKFNRYVGIEIKLTPNTNSPGQLAKYIYAIKRKYPDSVVRGILLAPEINKEIAELCVHFDLGFKELHGLDLILPTIKFPNPKRTSLVMHRLNKRLINPQNIPK